MVADTVDRITFEAPVYFLKSLVIVSIVGNNDVKISCSTNTDTICYEDIHKQKINDHKYVMTNFENIFQFGPLTSLKVEGGCFTFYLIYSTSTPPFNY